MSFFSDLGSIAREFNDIKNELTGTLSDAANDTASAAQQAYGDITSSVQSLTDDANAAQTGVADAVQGVRNIDVVQAAKDAIRPTDQ